MPPGHRGGRDRKGARPDVDRVDNAVRHPGHVSGDLVGRGEPDEGGSVRGSGGQADAGTAEPGERGVGAEQVVHVLDDVRVAGGGQALQLGAVGAAGVAMLHGRPQSGSG
jgi:hypothetical protein